MSNSIDAALSAKRKRGFWIAGCTAAFLSCVSYVNLPLVRFFNVHLFHSAAQDAPGWWLYVALRLPFVALFIWTVVHFPVNSVPAGRENKPSLKAPSFDPLMGLRALACMVVLMGHFFLVSFPFTGDVNRFVRILLVAPPWCGVSIFFTLSGYLMGKGFARGRYTLDESGMRSFLRNRLLRIGPIYFCALLLISLYRYTAILQWKHLWMLIEMFIFDYRGDLPINPIGALWSVSTEVQFYVLVPLLMMLLLRTHRKAGKAFVLVPLILVLAGTVSRTLIGIHFGTDAYAYLYSPLIPNLDLFLAGMSINLMPAVKLPASLHKLLGPILFAAAVIFYIGIGAAYFEQKSRLLLFWIEEPLFCAAFAMAFIYVAELRGSIAIKPGWMGKFLLAVQTVGTLTYCLYVFHPEVFIVNQALVPTVHPLAVSLAHFPLVMLELFAVASFFYFAVEKPFDLKKRVSGTVLEDAP
jgi:peptidoglycan/LPS O-acetylase OafA/YrhL